MFSGIVEETGTVLESGANQLVIKADIALEGVNPGDSVSVSGTCLTVTELGEGTARFGLMPETLRRTSLGDLNTGDTVNLERALAYGGQIGGHLTQGHVDATGEIVIRQPDGDALILGIRTPQSLMRYIVEKGFIAVEGASLTVVSVEEDVFTVSLVEFTQNATTLANLELGAMVNLEVDMIAKYVERMLEERHIVPATESERG